MAGSATQSPANIDFLLGPLLIGTIFNAFVYGICFMQFSTYWTSQWNDSYIIKYDATFSVYCPFRLFGHRLLVGWTFLLDTFHTSALTYMLWVYVVNHFLNPSILKTVLWPFSTTPMVTTLYGSLYPILEGTRRRVFFFENLQDFFPDSSISFLAHPTIFQISTSFSLSHTGGCRSSIPRFYLFHRGLSRTQVSFFFFLFWI